MATPLVAGLVGLLLSQNANLTGMEMRSLLQVTAAQVQIETACNCRIDAGNAMEALTTKKMFISPAALTLKPKETVQLNVVFGKAPYSFATQNEAVLTVDANGLVTAVGKGEGRILAKDSTGFTASTLDLRVDDGTSTSPGNPGNPGDPGAPGECPLGDPATCEMMCSISPDLPWCKK